MRGARFAAGRRHGWANGRLSRNFSKMMLNIDDAMTIDELASLSGFLRFIDCGDI